MKSSLGKIAILAFLAVLVIFAGCRTEEERSVQVGVILPLTGEAAAYGERLREGMELRKHVWEEQQDGALDVELIYEDSQAQPSQAVNALRKLIQSGVRLVLGPYTSGEVLAVAPIAEQNQVFVLSPGASSPDITNAGDYIYRIVASDIYDARIMAHFAGDSLDARTAAVVYMNNDYGVGVKNAFKEHFSSLGGEVVYEAAFESGTTDFRTILERLRSENPDAVVLIGLTEMGFFLRQMGELGLSFNVISSGLFENPDIVETAGQFAEGVHYTLPYYDLTGNDSVVVNFRRAFDELYPNEEPAVEHALGYDALNVLLHALEETDGSPEAVKENVGALTNFPGVAGSLTFDEHGDVSKPYGVKVYRNGQFQWLIPVYGISQEEI